MAIGIPGSPSYSLPAGEDEVMRRLANIERRMTEDRAGLSKSFLSTVAGMVQFGSIGLSTTNFTIPATAGTIVTGLIDIPPGFTEAAILGVVSLGAWNNTAATDYVYCQAVINGSPGSAVPESAGPSSYRAVSASAIRTLSNLTGPTISVGIKCWAAGGWGSSTANIANIDVIALFRR